VANLRSFAITNVSDIKAEITIYDHDGKNPRVMSFEQALLTHKNAIKEAETFIDMALTSLNSNSNNCAQVQLFKAPISRTNRINTSERFQDYANKLKNMIPKTIQLPNHPGHNAWKRRPPTTINLTDDAFPPLTAPKKKKTTEPMEPDNTTATGQTDSLTDVDVERIEQRQNEFAATLEKLRQDNETMQKSLQAQFESAMQALELRIEQRTQQIVSTMGQTINQAVEHMNAQSARSDERINKVLQSFQNQADRFTAQMDRMVSSPMDAQSNTPVRRTRARIWESPVPSMDDTEEWDDTMDEDDNNNNINLADGSRKSHASRTRHPQEEMDAATGGAL
jgi:flagellar biosynthesis/type III secretory pathway chaperone